jgi:hypothetical protein
LIAVLVAILDVLPIGWHLVAGSPLTALFGIPSLLVAATGTWAVVRRTR